MAEVVVSNMLDDDFPERARIEDAVRAAFEAATGTELWWVKLRPSSAPMRVSIDVGIPTGGMAFTSVAVDDDAAAIALQLRQVLPPPAKT